MGETSLVSLQRVESGSTAEQPSLLQSLLSTQSTATQPSILPIHVEGPALAPAWVTIVMKPTDSAMRARRCSESTQAQVA